MGIVFPFVMEYKINTVYPNAEIEYNKIKQMSCPEIQAKNAVNNYWSHTNGKIGRTMG